MQKQVDWSTGNCKEAVPATFKTSIFLYCPINSGRRPFPAAILATIHRLRSYVS